MSQIKILYKTEYYHRILYVLEINNKVTMLYKSSGLSGTGHKDKLLPFMFINDESRLYSSPIGYIYKVMYFNKVYISYKKELKPFPEVRKKIEEIKNFLMDTDNYDAEAVSPDIDNTTEHKKFVLSINKKLQEKTDGKEYFDYCLDKI
jgi:hypothetical protein